ncbi:MAG: hypothetical protein EXQ96_00225 [Alphaproteobacteria bacterium]|nr:hypothetical protein [Alphaproteobacteria bacterium]
MKVAAHFEKIGRLEALRRRLDRVQDFEIWFWATMNAGTNAINAALHATDITEDGPWYPQQPEVYMVPGKTSGGWVHAFRPLGDVLHVGRPKIEKPLPESVQKMAHLMEVIEEWRDPCVRDGHPVTPEILDKVERAYADLMAIAKTFAPQGR